jgi:hypothetical protein
MEGRDGTKRRSGRQRALAVLAALVLVNVVAVVAFTRSTTRPAPSGSLAGELVLPPENEALEHRGGSGKP